MKRLTVNAFRLLDVRFRCDAVDYDRQPRVASPPRVRRPSLGHRSNVERLSSCRCRALKRFPPDLKRTTRDAIDRGRYHHQHTDEHERQRRTRRRTRGWTRRRTGRRWPRRRRAIRRARRRRRPRRWLLRRPSICEIRPPRPPRGRGQVLRGPQGRPPRRADGQGGRQRPRGG